MSGNNKRIDKPYLYHNHKKPVTRRDFMGQGMLSFGAYVAMPSVLGMLSRQAYGQDAGQLVCSASSSGGDRMIPFIIFDLAGGANIAGTNVIAGDVGGQDSYLPDGSYATMGLAAAAEPSKVEVNRELGLAFHPASKMLEGIKATAGTAVNGVEGALFCAVSNDDTRNNPHNPLYWIAKSGLGGELVSLVGTSQSPSGGRSVAPASSIDPGKTPSVVARAADALGLVDPGRLAAIFAAAGMPQADAAQIHNKVLAATKAMSEAKLRQFQQKDVPTQIQELIRCGYINSSDLLNKFTPDQLNPLSPTNAAVTTAFPNTGNADEQKAATIAHLVLSGYAGAGVIELGGYDYHGQGRATQDRRDLEAGRMIGSTLALAQAKNTPVMIYVYTDGGVSANAGGAPSANGTLAFSNDSGERAAAFTLVYKPGNEGVRPAIRDGRRQIGAFRPGGTVDTTASKISNNVENLGKAVVANYLALHGREGDLAKVVGDDPFGAELEKQYLAFAKLI